MREMSARELKAYLETTDSQPLLLDVREPWEYDIARIDGSQLLPMRNIPEKLAELDQARETVLICHHGIRSRQVGRYLQSQGFTNLINLRGGVEEWAREVDKLMATY